MRKRITYFSVAIMLAPMMLSAKPERLPAFAFIKADTTYLASNSNDTTRTAKPVRPDTREEPKDIKEIAPSRRKPKPEKIDEPRSIRPGSLKPVVPGPQSLPGSDRAPQGPRPENMRPGSGSPSRGPQQGGGRRGG